MTWFHKMHTAIHNFKLKAMCSFLQNYIANKIYEEIGFFCQHSEFLVVIHHNAAPTEARLCHCRHIDVESKFHFVSYCPLYHELCQKLPQIGVKLLR